MHPHGSWDTICQLPCNLAKTGEHKTTTKVAPHS